MKKEIGGYKIDYILLFFLTLNQPQDNLVMQKCHTNLAKHSGFLPIYCCKRNVYFVPLTRTESCHQF